VQPSSAVDPLPDTTATQPDSADAVLSFSPAIVISDTISLQPPPRLAGLVTASDVVKDPLSPFPQLELPDIQLDGSMRVRAPYPADGPTQVVNIYVHNVGRADATEPFITIYVGDELAVRGALMNFNTNPDLNTLKPGEGGVVYAEFPVGVLQECNSVALAIEMHAVSAYRPATIAAYCPLRWSTPITAQRLGYEPNPRIAGTTLDDIVNNRVSVRPNDEYRCWSCHFTGSPHPYAPDPLLSITLTAEINGKFWGGQVQSWAYSLAQQSDQYKAPYIKALFTKWLADGSLP
jgi:hypothetical protein